MADVANSRGDVMSLVASLPRGKSPLYVARAVCRDAMNHGEIDGYRLGDIATPYHERRDVVPVSREQLGILATTLDAWRPGAGLLVWLGDGVGVRHGEVLALKLSDFRKDFSTVRIQRQLLRGKTAPLKDKRPLYSHVLPDSDELARRILDDM